MAGLQGWQLVIIIAIVLLLFAAPKLPAMAKNLGQSMRIFKSEVKQMKDDGTGTSQGSHQSTGSTDSEAVEGRIVNGGSETDREGRKTGTNDQP
ncbi:Sec-independent protein translocase subunit TatA [Citricoccus nitrophenolicus]|uniref:Sec-independent protein translocase protein TatA n=1 Tax=Citricoccus nitrophenolicus TaxID=863575 RepID=A0ABV0ID89_9MICC|nr:Sec-independent protein translocase subunit TatA [Citricoccus sp. I39-566]WMY77374.1 Sec-independent protein translocase subunit TatA [Citricoccus sp. I39-566]